MVHGVVRAKDAAGLGVKTVAFSGLAVIVSPAPEDADDPESAIALAGRHPEILCGVVVKRELPLMRLGAVFADADALASGLAGMADLSHTRLAPCAGAVEYSLVAKELGAPPGACEAAAGRDYLKSRAAALTDARARPARLAAALAPRLRDLALLVQHDASDTVFDALGRRRADLAFRGLAMSLHGPRPVCSFASLTPASLS